MISSSLGLGSQPLPQATCKTCRHSNASHCQHEDMHCHTSYTHLLSTSMQLLPRPLFRTLGLHNLISYVAEPKKQQYVHHHVFLCVQTCCSRHSCWLHIMLASVDAFWGHTTSYHLLLPVMLHVHPSALPSDTLQQGYCLLEGTQLEARDVCRALVNDVLDGLQLLLHPLMALLL